MGIPKIRTELQSIIEKADDRIIKMVYAMLKSYQQDEIIGFTVEGAPLTISRLEQQLAASEQEIKEGKTHTHEQVKERFNKKDQ